MEIHCDLCPHEDTERCNECELIKSLSRTNQTSDKQILTQAKKEQSAERNELISDNN